MITAKTSLQKPNEIDFGAQQQKQENDEQTDTNKKAFDCTAYSFGCNGSTHLSHFVVILLVVGGLDDVGRTCSVFYYFCTHFRYLLRPSKNFEVKIVQKNILF